MADTPPSHGARSENIMATSGPSTDSNREHGTTSSRNSVPAAWASAYNNPQGSDVRIRQFCNGHVKLYFAHKHILEWSGSEWFRQLVRRDRAERSRAEPTAARHSSTVDQEHTLIVNVHDDDPVHFELMLKWLYTRVWDRDIEAQRGFYGESCNRSKAFVAVGVYALAIKYGVPSLRDRAHLMMVANPCLFNVWARGQNDMVNMMLMHNTRCLVLDCEMCDTIWDAFIRSPEVRIAINTDIAARGYARLRQYIEWLMWVIAMEEWEARMAAWLDANT